MPDSESKHLIWPSIGSGELEGPVCDINLAALRHNGELAKFLSLPGRLLCTVKANGYGHGVEPVCRALEPVANGWSVARISEGEALRQLQATKPIIVMGPNWGDSEASYRRQLERCVASDLTPVIHNDQFLEALLQACADAEIAPWIKVDTGMHRLGINPSTLLAVTDRLDPATVIMTHFAAADDAVSTTPGEQQQLLEAVLQDTSGTLSVSATNSAALLTGVLPAGDQHWSRPGIMLYGSNPLGAATDNQHAQEIAVTSRFSAPVIAVRTVPRGESVGYNNTWVADRDSRIATVAAGYADGYPRHAPSGTAVALNGERAPLAGRVSMDMISIDTTDCTKDVNIGDVAELWGPNITPDYVASQASTIAYQLFTQIGERVEKRYLENPAN